MSVEGVHALVRRTHEERVLRVLREHGALSRGQIAAKVGLSRTTLSEIAGDLLSRGAVVVIDTDAGLRAGSGRPAELLTLDPSSGRFLGVDLGRRRVRVAVADAAHEVIATGHAAYGPGTGWPERVAVAFDLIDDVGARSGISFRALQGVGVGVAGPRPVEPAVAEAFRERFGAPVIADGSTRFAALAEAVTDVPELHDVLYIRLADGIDGGLVVGGRLVTGGHGVAGEFGHVPAVLPVGGPAGGPVGGRGEPVGGPVGGPDPCRCGRRGCLETVASVPAVLRTCRRRGLAVRTADDLEAALRRGDPVAAAVLDEAAVAVGQVLAAAALVLDPARIVVGGRLTRCWPGVVDRIAATVAERAGARVAGGGDRVVRAARLGDEDGALGAIAVLYRQAPLLAGYH
ncbi:ROK family transcriptional regulator [Dactylosporangium aurantiacum]|uniref:ROK family transcriptional regulator n=1 Tax=Dactylosporangium aurantiacum TaxID=35754 RepID=A0A9Q9ILP0_9ACTN|nr:ROK family transcriptional regulator [Dactylosporangium aurantiacum]UWZ57153.1 ROK family transcriptional regulator [Dactylosporangium aurantiacum]